MIQLKINSEFIDDVRLAIFDKDGTLINLYEYWSNMVAFRVDLAQKKLGFYESYKKQIMYAMGVDLDNRRLRSEGPVGLAKREIVMQSMEGALAAIGQVDTHAICYEIFDEVDRFSLDHFAQIIKPVNGMHALLETIHNKECKIAVATTDKSERARLALDFLGISDLVTITVGADMVEHCKPAPDMIHCILQATGISKEHTIMVGDAITDVEMGINADVKASIGVCSGLTFREELLRVTRYVVNDISNIITL